MAPSAKITSLVVTESLIRIFAPENCARVVSGRVESRYLMPVGTMASPVTFAGLSAASSPAATGPVTARSSRPRLVTRNGTW